MQNLLLSTLFEYQQSFTHTCNGKSASVYVVLMRSVSSWQVQELLQRIQKAAACTCLLPLGKDRLFRRYWLIPSACALFVEEDFFGLTEDMLLPCPKPSEDAAANMEDTKAETEQPGEKWVFIKDL